MKTYVHLWQYLARFFLGREMFQADVVEKIKTHTLCLITIFRSRTLYEIMWTNIVEQGRPQIMWTNIVEQDRPQIMWTNIVEQDRPQMTIWPMRIACWIPKITDMLSQYVTLIAFPRQQWFRERASIRSYLQCLFVCVCFYIWKCVPVHTLCSETAR